jgi:hypothetical protein
MNIRSLAVIALIGALTGSVQAQNIGTGIGGLRSALDYAYGWPGVTATNLAVAPNGGNPITGSSTITLNTGVVGVSNQGSFAPLATNTPIYVGQAGNIELVTPTSVSGCGAGQPLGACQVTAVFANLHGPSDPVISGSYGLQEAINGAHGGGGGVVMLSSGWAGLGATNATIAAAASYSNVFLQDNRFGYTTGGGFVGSSRFWSMQPSTLTSLAVPATLAAGTVVFAAAPVGTWANSAYYFCVTYVDALGGEGPCSLTYNQTPTVNYSVTITAPVASTGAVGWRFYAGASYNAAYLMPIDSTHCTLTTLEQVMPACAIGSNGGWIAPPVTTTSLRPNATVTTGALASPTVNISATQPQGHTTFAYQPTGSNPQVFQTHYGPFPAYGSTTAGQVDTLGSINLPTGFFNYIGRTIKLRGKVSLGTVNTAALPTITVLLSWVGGTTAGVGVTTCSFEGVAAGATKTYNGQFECTLDTNAIGATAVGTIMPGGYLLLQAQDISAAGLGPYIDTNTAAVGSLGLFAQDTINIVYTSTTNTTTAPVMLGLDVEVTQ